LYQYLCLNNNETKFGPGYRKNQSWASGFLFSKDLSAPYTGTGIFKKRIWKRGNAAKPPAKSMFFF